MSIIQIAKEYTEAFLELIYPSKTICYICGGSLEKEAEYSLCMGCYKELPFMPQHCCQTCGVPLRMIEDGPTCEGCKNSTYYFNRVVSVVQYEEEIKKLIYRFKYSNHTYLARVMGAIMADRLKQEGIEPDLIVPIPLYKAKEKERGFNQARLLGKYIAKEIGIPFNTETLIRVKNTKVMHNLSKRQRQENVQDAFRVIENGVIVNKDILLIDDIFTTGATVNICSKLLMESGAGSVTVLTFARD